MPVSFYVGNLEERRHDDRLCEGPGHRYVQRQSAVAAAACWQAVSEVEHSVTRGTFGTIFMFGTTFIDGGIPEGYINQRIHQLSEVARAADDGNVNWG